MTDSGKHAWPGAYCSPPGATSTTKNGTAMVCGLGEDAQATDRPRWRRNGPKPPRKSRARGARANTVTVLPQIDAITIDQTPTVVEPVYDDSKTDGATFWPTQGKQVQPFELGQQLIHSNRGPCVFRGLDETTPNGETSWVDWPDGTGGMVTTRLLSPKSAEDASPKPSNTWVDDTARRLSGMTSVPEGKALLDGASKEQLRRLAEKIGIRGTAGKNRGELIDAITYREIAGPGRLRQAMGLYDGKEGAMGLGVPGKSTTQVAPTASVRDRILSAYHDLSAQAPVSTNDNALISIKDLRERLPEIPAEELDQHLKAMDRDKTIALSSDATYRSLPPDVQDKAVMLGGTPQHFLSSRALPSAAVQLSGQPRQPLADAGQRPVSDEAIRQRITDTYAGLAGEPNALVSLVKLRGHMPDVPAEDMNRVLKAMDRERELHLDPDSNRKALPPEAHRDAVRIGGEDKHFISMHGVGGGQGRSVPAPRPDAGGTDMPSPGESWAARHGIRLDPAFKMDPSPFSPQRTGLVAAEQSPGPRYRMQPADGKFHVVDTQTGTVVEGSRGDQGYAAGLAAAANRLADQPPAPALSTDPRSVTPHQFGKIMDLLRRRTSGGFMTGPTSRAGVSQMSEADAEAYISSLSENY